MRIGIDARSLSIGGGVRYYILNLITNLTLIDRQNQYFIYYDNEKFLGTFKKYPNINERVIKLKSRLIIPYRDQILLKRAIKKDNIDIIHGTKSVAPFFSKAKSVITFLDLTPILYPNEFKFFDRIYWNFILPYAVKYVDHIISISENTKKDLVENFKVESDKISVVLLGVSKKYHPIKNTEVLQKTKQNYNLPPNFILYVGTYRPRKNIESIIKAFYKFKRNDNNYKLVLCGKKLYKENIIIQLVKELKLTNDVFHLGYIKDDDLPVLYNLADLFVYPSFYEGFGLPVIEAMACGTPVIASNTASLPEVVGAAGIIINPRDIDSLTNAIYKVLHSKSIQDKMIINGITQAKKFSWKKCARETLEVYKSLL